MNGALFRIVEICAVRHGRAFIRQGSLLVGDASLSRFCIERQDGVIFDKGHESLGLPGTPQQRQQHDGGKNLHWNPLSGRATDTSTPLVDCENVFQGMALWGSRAPGCPLRQGAHGSRSILVKTESGGRPEGSRICLHLP